MSRRLLNRFTLAWASYDFANSTFSTSVLSVIFSVYFARVVVPHDGVALFGRTIPGEALWGYIVSASMALVIVAAPLLGARADRKGTKRLHLMVSASIGALATCWLFSALPGDVAQASLLILIALVGFELSLVFYNAFLNDISIEEERGRISGLGFALGYIGGGLCLALNMVMMAKPELFGLASDDKTLPVRASILVAGLWWLVFSFPSFLILRDRPVLLDSTRGQNAFVELWHTVRDLRGRPDLGRFLLSYLIFNDGVQTIILMASIFGASALGMSTAQLAACFLMIQFVAFAGALAAGKMADALGHRSVVLTTLAVFIGVSVWGMYVQSIREFWILGAVVGIVLGGSQAASRSLFSLMIPTSKDGEYYALFSVVGKAASFFGPFIFGAATQAYGIRRAVGVVGIFFLVGGLLLLTVNEQRGRTAAQIR